MACRLISLDKNPGLRPVSVGETFCQIAGKVIVFHNWKDLISSGSLQVWTGHEAGCESIIHAIHKIYEEDKSETILLVDASNVFSSVNRKTFLLNIRMICPPLAKFVWNCYNLPSQLCIIGGGEIDPLKGQCEVIPLLRQLMQ